MKPKFIVTFVLFIFTGLFAFTFIFPKIEEASALQEKLSRKKKEAEIVKAKFETTKRAISQFESLSQAKKDRVNSAFSDKIDLPDLFVLIDSLISKSGLVGEDIHVEVREDGGSERAAPVPVSGSIVPRFLSLAQTKGIGEIDISSNVIGDYASFKAFLLELEKSLRIFDIQSVSFSVPGQSEQISGIFRFSIVVKTYYQK